MRITLQLSAIGESEGHAKVSPSSLDLKARPRCSYSLVKGGGRLGKECSR